MLSSQCSGTYSCTYSKVRLLGTLLYGPFGYKELISIPKFLPRNYMFTIRLYATPVLRNTFS